MATADEIGQEKQGISERLPRLDAERTRLGGKLNELEIAERADTLRRKSGYYQGAEERTLRETCASGHWVAQRRRWPAGGFLPVSTAVVSSLVRVGRHGGGVAALYRGGSAGPSSRILVRDNLRTSVQ